MKKSESGYLVRWKIDIYTLQSFHKSGKYVIKDGELVCDTVYLNPISNSKQWFTPYENENQGKKIVRSNNVILNKVKPNQ